MKKPFPTVEVTLDKIVGGGQTLGLLPNGKKIFVWGGLPRESSSPDNKTKIEHGGRVCYKSNRAKFRSSRAR